MLVSYYSCLALLLALESAMVTTAAHSPFVRKQLEQRLSKRDLDHPPAGPEGDDGSHGNVTGHPPTPDLLMEDGEDIATDYDFVLDLDEQEDFDRLLNMLSRSGPAKPLNEETAGPSSTFLDRHDEMVHPSSPPDSSRAAPFLPHGSKYTPQKVDPHTDGSHFDDLEQEKKDAEQRRLEELYFNQVKGKHETSSEEKNDSWRGALHNSARSLDGRTSTVSLLALLMLFYLL